MCAIVSVVVVALRVWIICRAEASFRKHMRSLASLKDFFLVFTTATVIVVVGLVTNTVMLVEDTEGRLARDHPELPARQREQLMTTDEITAVVKVRNCLTAPSAPRCSRGPWCIDICTC